MCQVFPSSVPGRGSREEVVWPPAGGGCRTAGGQGNHHGHGEHPLGSGEERHGEPRNIRQGYRLTLSLCEATLWSLSIPDDKICRWKPAFAPSQFAWSSRARRFKAP